MTLISPYAYPGLIKLPYTRVSISQIFTAVCKYYGQREERCKLKGRKPEMVKIRQITCYLAQKKTDMTLTAIGKFFDKDHTTVIHSIRTVQNMIDTNTWNKTEILEILTK